MKAKKISRICIVDTIYTLFLYLLISTEKEIEETFFYWSSGIPQNIRDYFKKQSYYFNQDELSKISYHKLCIKLKLLRYFKWPFLIKNKISYWGHSHLKFSCGIIGNNSFNLIEDGLGNYYYYGTVNPQLSDISPRVTKKRDWLKKLIFGSFYLPEYIWGENPKCKSVYLTGLMDINERIKNKSKIICIKDLWKNSTNNKQNLILNIYNIKQEDIDIFKNKTDLLITQCFSEDKECTEKTKIKMYKDIIEQYCKTTENIIIKTHPRETTDYSKHIPNITIFNKNIPFELLLLLKININKIITINSTVAHNLPEDITTIYLEEKYLKYYKNH